MRRVKKHLFGKVYQFEWTNEFNALVQPSVALYPDAANDDRIDVKITISEKLADFSPHSVNPKIHQFASGEMRTQMGSVTASWCYLEHGILAVRMSVPQTSWLKSIVQRARSIEYPTKVERFEQLLHELVLVPSVYFFADKAPIHSAAIATRAGTLLLAGTGGVGKSSALLSFRNCEDCDFIADDIAVISETGSVHGNMAWPKIYGYNCVGNGMARELLAGRGVADWLHFQIRNRVNPVRVRRKISPDRLFRSVVSEESPLGTLYYLFREDVPKISVGPLCINSAIDMTVAVMESEYGIFHRHLHWEEYNALSSGKAPLLTMDKVRKKWRQIYRGAFANARIIKVSIPLEIDHIQYQSRIREILLERTQ